LVPANQQEDAALIALTLHDLITYLDALVAPAARPFAPAVLP
jgi:hypothetical protein